MLERKHGLDQTCNAGRGIEMSNICLKRAKTTETDISGLAARNTLVSAAISIGSPSWRSGAVRFDVGDRSRINTRQRLRRGDHFDLAVDARGSIAGFAGTVVVDRLLRG